MERRQRGLIFWVLLLVTAMLPASATATGKKALYHANIASGGFGVGGSTLTVKPEGIDYWVKTFNAPNRLVTKATLSPTDGAWNLVLCEQGGDIDCTYNELTGELEIEGRLIKFMYDQAGITGGPLNTALKEGRLTVQLNDGALGSGTFVRIM